MLWYNTVQLIDSWLAKLHLNNLKSPQVMGIIVYVECSCMFRKQDTAFCYLVGDVPELPFNFYSCRFHIEIWSMYKIRNKFLILVKLYSFNLMWKDDWIFKDIISVNGKYVVERGFLYTKHFLDFFVDTSINRI